MPAGQVRRAVHFERNSAGNTRKIDDEDADRMLSPKFEAAQRTIAQRLPQQPLRRHRTLTQ
jgi:hypothetical protein